ncbi:hypothetical protein C5167_013319 [Papaver somniferum]|uniref:NAC domain-containing protein n=1 Tax=Papaver somniferum TaxID=3469 RepID=A0A4Y7IZZ4_PAPSO|nr:NAC domain-containing protein 104-like [Papaver somniferum]RZC54463.1 hypothetical protein C5167_013319 [Papaver somniferum]
MGDNNKNNVRLPPGFRFNPTDQELILHFLHRKASLLPCVPDVIPDLDLYPYDPWDLNGKALAGDYNQWYFFSRRTSNRISASGYWMALDDNLVDEPILLPNNHKKTKVAGLKRCLGFYLAHGLKTNWIMHEYRLTDSRGRGSSSSSSSISSRSSKQRRPTDSSKWVVCRVFEQGGGSEGSYNGDDDEGITLSGMDEVFLSLDDLDDISLPYQ